MYDFLFYLPPPLQKKKGGLRRLVNFPCGIGKTWNIKFNVFYSVSVLFPTFFRDSATVSFFSLQFSIFKTEIFCFSDEHFLGYVYSLFPLILFSRFIKRSQKARHSAPIQGQLRKMTNLEVFKLISYIDTITYNSALNWILVYSIYSWINGINFFGGSSFLSNMTNSYK